MLTKLCELITMSNDEYHRAPGLGSTMLRDYATSPLLYYHRHILKSLPFEESSAMKLGSVVDALILDQDAVSDLVAVIPSEVLNKDGHRKGSAWTEWAGQMGDRLLLKVDEWDDLRSMADSVWACPPAVDLISSSQHQKSLFWQDNHGFTGKCRFDGIMDGGFFDLKTTSKSLGDFHYAVKDLKYLTQLAWYARGYQELNGEYPSLLAWVVISKVKPYECMVMEPEGDFETLAQDHINRLLAKLDAQIAADAGWHDTKYNDYVPFYLNQFSMGGF